METMVSDPHPHPDDALTAQLRLRPERPRVTRLSRKVLAGLGGIVGIAVLGAMIWALQSRSARQDNGTELYSTDHKTTADGLATLPKDYAGLPRDTPPPRTVPQLGPPLPGDLGRPILAAQGASSGGLDAGEQRIVQENEAARVSRVFASTNVRQSPASSAASPATSTANATAADGKPPLDPDALQNMQDRKLAFVNATADKRTVSPDRIEKPASRYIVQAGAVIPAALITGIRSDLPGEITAQVTENVYDSPTGKYLLVPQGARLIGQYDSQISFGQSRVLLVSIVSSCRTASRLCWSGNPARIRKGTPASRMASTITGAIFCKRRLSRLCLGSAANSCSAATTHWFARCAAAARIRSTRAARPWCVVNSTYNRHSPSGRAFR